MTIETFPLTTLGSAAAAVVERTDARRKIEKIAITDREMWLAMRRKDITASAVGGLLGISDYLTPFHLFALKAGLIEEEADEDVIDGDTITLSPMGRGTLLEDKGGELLRRLKPKWKVEKCQHYFRDPAVRLGATPDYLCEDERGARILVQIKNPEGSIFRTKWRTEDGRIEPPIEYVVQTIVEADLTAADRAYVGVFVVGHKTTFQLIPIDMHVAMMARIRDLTVDFWDRIARGDNYDPDYAADGELLAQLYGADNGETIDLSGWNQAPEIADEDERLKAEIKERDGRRKAIKAEIIDKMGSAAVATFNGRIYATAKTIHRSAYPVAATSYRSVLIKKEGASHGKRSSGSRRPPSQSAAAIGGEAGF